MLKPLILVGGGGHCKSVIEAAESTGYTILGILDLNIPVGDNVLGYKVIGKDDQISSYVEEAEFVITVGFIKNPSIRIKLYNKIKGAGGKLATIVASTAYVSNHAEVGEGTVVLHHAFVNAGANVGKNVILNTATNIEHDAIIGDHCHISTGTMINGEAQIGEATFIGSRSVVNQCVKVCGEVVIASGSVVRKDIEEPGIYVGNPIKRIQ